MPSAQNSKRAEGLRPRIRGHPAGESETLCGFCRSVKDVCLIGGILCFGILFVVSIILVVSGIAAVGISNSKTDKVPRFFEDPLEAAGSVMVLTGLVMMAILGGLWYTAEKRHEMKKRKAKRLINASQSGAFLFPSCLGETSTMGEQTASYLPDSNEQLDPLVRQMGQLLTEGQEQLPFPGEPPGGQMSYPAAPPGRRLSYPNPSSGSELSYASTSSTEQLPYPTAPPSSQILCGLPSARQLFFSGESVSFSQQFYPSEQAYHSQALVLNGYTDGVNIDFLNEPPPPYTP
ncbi:uncharacterized protein [Macrobrachium rosenbergii]|uniref:uncharacterized protein n=1 Tax=Macrobrachium rosenbergii TaxID=79674 RepID=UPI0034D76BA8